MSPAGSQTTSLMKLKNRRRVAERTMGFQSTHSRRFSFVDANFGYAFLLSSVSWPFGCDIQSKALRGGP